MDDFEEVPNLFTQVDQSRNFVQQILQREYLVVQGQETFMSVSVNVWVVLSHLFILRGVVTIRQEFLVNKLDRRVTFLVSWRTKC